MKNILFILLVSISAFASDHDTHRLEVQTLIDSLGNTDVEIELEGNEGSTIPDVAKKIQLKSYDRYGKLTWTKNFQNVVLDKHRDRPIGRTSFRFDDVKRFQTIHTQVLLENQELNFTNVITNDSKALLRPDMAIVDVDYPEAVYVGEVVNITALIEELNGDVSGNTHVSLTGDGGRLVDEAFGVYLNAGNDAAVRLSTVFEKPGTYQLTINIDGVWPGDYDVKNNVYHVEIEVLNPIEPVFSTLNYSYTNSDHYREYSNQYANGTSHRYGVVESFSQTLFLPETLTFPVSQVDFHLEADGKTIFGISINDIETTTDRWYGCMQYQNAWVQLADNVSVYLINRIYEGCEYGKNFTSAMVQKSAVDQVFYSENHSIYWGSSESKEVSRNGTFINAQAHMKSSFYVKDDGVTYGGQLKMLIKEKQPTFYEWDYNYEDGSYNRGYITTEGFFGGVYEMTRPVQ